jgi:hypothetical protein
VPKLAAKISAKPTTMFATKSTGDNTSTFNPYNTAQLVHQSEHYAAIDRCFTVTQSSNGISSSLTRISDIKNWIADNASLR